MSIDQTIAYLESLDLNVSPIDEIRKGIRQLGRFPVHVTEFQLGTEVYRVRSNEGEVSFTNIAELSYKPEEYNRSYQRASRPGRTMFYGAIMPLANRGSEIDMERVISAAEGCKLFRDKSIEEGQETITFSRWRTQRTINLLTILFPEVEKNNSPFAQEHAQIMRDTFSAYGSDALLKGTQIYSFYADQFTKQIEWSDQDDHDLKYLHSALFTDAVLRIGEKLDGICYASGRVDGKGINVAIKPEFVSAHMRLEVAMECILAKRGKKFACADAKLANVTAGKTDLIFNELLTPDQIQREIEIMLNLPEILYNA